MKKWILLLCAALAILLSTGCASNPGSILKEYAQIDISETIAKEEPTIINDRTRFESVTLDTTVGEVIHNPVFRGFGRLLFPVDLAVDESLTMKEISSPNTYIWYSDIQPAKTVEIINDLKNRAENGEQIFYSIYSQDEIAGDPSKANTGLFYFKGTPGKEFAIMNAGGGFMYVGAMHDSFPHSLKVSKLGYNAFALIYRPDFAYDDLAQAIGFIYDHADELEVKRDGYSLWGGSAGARMAASLGRKDAMEQYGRPDIPPAIAVIIRSYCSVPEPGGRQPVVLTHRFYRLPASRRAVLWDVIRDCTGVSFMC